jgi:hypothetical protein
MDWVADNKREERRANTQALQTKITVAQKNASSDGKSWTIYSSRDPASYRKIARTAVIKSDDGLCSLYLQKQITGKDTVGLNCSDVRIKYYDDIYYKFDTSSASKKIGLYDYDYGEKHNADVYISFSEYEDSYLPTYNDFKSDLIAAGALAIKIPSAGGFWVRFSLDGAAEVLNKLGKVTSIDSAK